MNRLSLPNTSVTSQRTRDELIHRLHQRGITHVGVLDAMRNTPRHLFIDAGLAARAYDETALPIGYGQTISHPYTVARMVSLALEGRRSLDKVLEIGVGCGYQAAILSHFTQQLFGLERINALAQATKLRMHHLHYFNVRIRHGDGYEGWEYHAPYQAIILAAAPVEVPKCLYQQLDLGGRIIAPVGSHAQQLIVIEKNHTGFKTSIIEDCSFVPLLPGLE